MNAKPSTYERDIERFLVTKIKQFGGEIRKVKWIGRNAAPDRRVLLHGGVWVELKAPGKYPTPAQAREHARMRKHGEVVTVVASVYGVTQFLIDLIANRKLKLRYE